MAINFDGATKTISLTLGTTTLSVKDLYSRWKDWVLLSDNSKWPEAFAPLGGDDIDATAGTKVPLYAFLTNGWRIRPQEANHTLNVTEGILLVQGGGDPFLNTIGSFVVRVNYQQPVQAITVQTSGAGGTSDWTEEQKRQIRHRLGLDGTTSEPAATPSLVAAMWNHAVEGSVTAVQGMRRMFAALFGRTAGVGTSTENFKSLDGNKDRITMEYDGSGNRTNPAFDDT